MNRQFVWYLDNCVFSELLKQDAKGLRESFIALPHRIAFSDIHILEMRSNHEEYSSLLNDLDAVFVRNPGQMHERHDQISSLDPALLKKRFAEHFENLQAYNAFEAMLTPMHHLLGGAREKSMDQVASAAEGEIAEALKELLNDEADGNAAELYNTLKRSTETLATIEVSKGWQAIDTQVSAAREGDPMREMDPIEKVRHVISNLEPEGKRWFTDQYPEKFAQLRILKTGELAGFAFALFCLGLTKRKGIFAGSRQKLKFAAQFRDAQHIEEASRCDFFVTFDKAASELAASTFAYAGFATNTLLLKK